MLRVYMIIPDHVHDNSGNNKGGFNNSRPQLLTHCIHVVSELFFLVSEIFFLSTNTARRVCSTMNDDMPRNLHHCIQDDLIEFQCTIVILVTHFSR